MPVHLADLPAPILSTGATRETDLARFAAVPYVAALGWPLDVVDQWLFDHGEYPPFRDDYGHVDLSAISWRRERISTAAYLDMTTGASDPELLDDNARNHVHRTSVRPIAVAESWRETGTWLRPPILLAREFVDAADGLEVVEGRTRVGILWGRVADGLHVADEHEAWVGRSF